MKTLSLRNRLLLWSAVVTMTTLTAVILLVDASFRSNIRQDLVEDLKFALRVAEGVRARQMEERIAETVQTATDTRLRAAVETGDSETVRQTLVEVVPRGRTGWSAVIDRSGGVLAATPGAPVERLGSSRRLIDEALYYDTGDLWTEGGTLVEVAASAVLFGATPLGVLVTGAPIGREAVSDMEAAVGRAASVEVGGKLVLGQASNELSRVAQAELATFSVSDREDVEAVSLGREAFVSASLPLLSSQGDTIGTLTLLGSLDEALQPSRSLRSRLIGIFFIGLMLAFVATRVFFRAIIVPVNRLVRETRRLGSGDLENPIHAVRGDEIGQLASSFEKMRVSLRGAREELIRNERLSAIGQAASAVAHDFAQPLTTVMGAVGMLQMTMDDPDRREHSFETIERELGRLQRMKSEILEFARGEASLDCRMVPIDGFLEQVTAGVKADVASRGVEIRTTHGYTGTWSIDGHRLGRVIENLVRNAAVAIQGEGTVHVRTAGLGDKLWIEVEDDGPGIPADLIDRLFEPFVSHGKKDGTGLGLAIAKNVVVQHGGTIDVTSSADGTCFTIELPGTATDEAVQDEARSETVEVLA